jgi:hypothetical protein
MTVNLDSVPWALGIIVFSVELALTDESSNKVSRLAVLMLGRFHHRHIGAMDAGADYVASWRSHEVIE